MKRRIKRISVTLLTLVLLLTALCSTASANDVNGLENISGDGQYMSSNYVDNYAFDCEELGFMDSIEKIWLTLDNVIFSLCRYIALLGLRLFRFSLQLNIAELMGARLDTVQLALTNSIFEPLFIVGFIGVAIALLKKLLRRNLTGVIAEFGKVLLILIFVALLGQNTTDVLTNTATISRDLGLSVVMQMNGRDADANASAFVDETVGILWGDMIHRPWLEMEFEGNYTDADVEAILSRKPGSEARQDVVNQYIQAHPESFAKGGAWAKIPVLFLYLIVMVLKMAIYMACALVVLAFQLLAIFYALLGVIILLLAMFDSLGGLYLVTDWLKRMLETQLMTLITTMLLGFIIWFGSVMDSAGSSLGWLGGLLLQTLVIVILFVFRKQIFRGISRATNSPRAIPQQLLAMSPAGIAGAVMVDRQIAYDRSLKNKNIKADTKLKNEQRGLTKAQTDLTVAQEDLTATQQGIADLKLEKEEAAKTQRIAREEKRAAQETAREAARAKKQKQQKDDTAVQRPKTTQETPKKQEQQPQEPEVERPTTASVSYTDRVETSAKEADAVYAYAPVAQPVGAEITQSDSGPKGFVTRREQAEMPDVPAAERPTTQQPDGSVEETASAAATTQKTAATADAADAATAQKTAAVVAAQQNKPHTAPAYLPQTPKPETNAEDVPAAERPTTQQTASAQEPPQEGVKRTQEQPGSAVVSALPNAPKTPPAAAQRHPAVPLDAPMQIEGVERPAMVAQREAPTQESGTREARPGTATPLTSDVSATAQKAAAAAKSEQKQMEARRTVGRGGVNYGAQPTTEPEIEDRPRLRDEITKNDEKEDSHESND